MVDYWIAIDKQKIGPLSLDDVRSRRLAPETLVWHRGLPTWQRADTLPELAGSLAVNPTPPASPITPASPSPLITPSPLNTPSSPSTPVAPPEKPTTYLGWNIAAIILCCFIPAIVGLIYSIKVSSRYDIADYEGARRASETAGIWLIVSIVCGLVMLPFQILISLLGN